MNTSKKIVSLILSLLIMLSLCLPVCAAEDEITCPVIYIPGVDSSPIYADKNDPDSRMSLIDVDIIKSEFSSVVFPALVAYSVDKDADKLADKICDSINTIYADWFMNYDGTAKNNSGTVLSYPESVNKNSNLTFYYDWRGDPVEAAAQLRAYIEYVCAASGCEKVALSTHSLGGVVALTYLTLFADDTKIMGVVFDTPVIDGVSYLDEILCAEASINSEGLKGFLKGVLSTGDYEELIASVFGVLELSPVSETFTELVDEALKDITPVVFEKSIIPLFGLWPSIWAMVPENEVADTINYVFDTVLKDEDTSALEAKIQAYNTIRSKSKDTLTNYDATGRVAVISRFGYSSLPITESWNSISDLVVDTSSSSLGATTAAAGRYFDDEYLEGKDMKFISPDRTVDASTCLFPEKTWFVKGVTHSETSVTRAYHSDLLFAEQEATCDTSSLNRFSSLDRASGTLIKDTSIPLADEEMTFLEKLFAFVRAIINKIIDVLFSIF